MGKATKVELYDAFVCHCLGSIHVETGAEPDDYGECLNCGLIAPVWYLRLMGIHECERDSFVDAFERAVSMPVEFLGREYGRTRKLDDYANIRAMLADGYEWVPDS